MGAAEIPTGLVVGERFQALVKTMGECVGQQTPSLCVVAAHCAYVRPMPPCCPHRPMLACVGVRYQASPQRQKPRCLCHKPIRCRRLLLHVCPRPVPGLLLSRVLAHDVCSPPALGCRMGCAALCSLSVIRQERWPCVFARHCAHASANRAAISGTATCPRAAFTRGCAVVRANLRLTHVPDVCFTLFCFGLLCLAVLCMREYFLRSARLAGDSTLQLFSALIFCMMQSALLGGVSTLQLFSTLIFALL